MITGSSHKVTAIEVLEVRRVDGHGNLKTFAKIRFGSVVIHGCRVIQTPGQTPWVFVPQQPTRKKADGTDARQFGVVEITRKKLLDKVRGAVLKAWERWV